MSKKGKGSEKGGKKRKTVATNFDDTNRLTEVDRAFYELEIQSAKKKILTLRSHIQNLLVSNDKIQKDLQTLTVGKVSKAAKLEQQIKEIDDEILRLQSENIIHTDKYNKEKRETDETISDLELKSKAMHMQLSAEIKRLNGRLNACEELRDNWDKWMMKYAERAEEIAAKNRNAEENLIQIEKKAIAENEALKEDLLEKITFAGEEFNGAGNIGDTTSATFNMRLIRENIALQKNIDILIKSNIDLDMRMKQELEIYEKHKEDIPKLEKKNAEIILDSQTKIDVINNLTMKVKSLKKEYISTLSYREQNVTLKQFQMCARFRRKKLKRNVNIAGQKINSMVREVNLYEYLINQYQIETRKIANHLENLRSTIERSLLLRDPVSIDKNTPLEVIERLKRERNDMLGILLELLQVDFDALDPGRRASIVSLEGYDKLVRFDSLFRKQAPSLSSLMDICVAYIDSDEEDVDRTSSVVTVDLKDTKRDKLDETYVPTQRPLGRNYLFDIESGTSLYFSSPRAGDPELALAEEQGAAADEEEEEESDESWSSASKKSKEKESAKTTETVQPPPATTTAKVATETAATLPPGAIVDVVTDYGEEYEEEPISEEYIEEENEEYDINLFY